MALQGRMDRKQRANNDPVPYLLTAHVGDRKVLMISNFDSNHSEHASRSIDLAMVPFQCLDPT